MRNSDSDKQDINIYDKQMISQIPYGGMEPTTPGFGSSGLLILVIITLVIALAVIIPLLFLNNTDVNYSGLGLSYRFQKQDEWIYYNEYDSSSYSGGLWRRSSDGEAEEKIVDSKVDLFAMYGDQILYFTHSDNDEWILHTAGMDGKDEKILYQSDEDSPHIIKMDAAAGRCYTLDVDNRLSVIELASGKASELNDETADFCIKGDWIYYLKVKPDSEKELYQLWRTDVFITRDQQLMNSFESAVDYVDGKIYYINYEDGDIYCVDIYGENEQKILECEGRGFIKVIGDWIYYGNRDENPAIYKVRTNGKNNQKIDDYGMRLGFSLHCTSVLDNWVWYVDMDDRQVSFIKMVRISDKYTTDDVIEDILEDLSPSWVIRKFE